MNEQKSEGKGHDLPERYELCRPGVVTAALTWFCACIVMVSLAALPGCSSETLGPTLAQPGDPERKTPGKQAAQLFQILNENEARQIATTFLNEQLKGRQFLAPSGMVDFVPIEPERWESIVYDYRQGRIVLRHGGYGGWEATVSLAHDGSDPRVEHAELAWN